MTVLHCKRESGHLMVVVKMANILYNITDLPTCNRYWNFMKP